MKSDELRIELAGEDAQEAFGTRMAAACDGPLLIFLQGELGAGKTTLTRGLLRGLGHRGAVKSPTYTLIEPYQMAPRNVYHLDLYRVTDPGELEYLGLREMLEEDAIVLIEWPERGEGWLPTPDLHLSIGHMPAARELSMRARTERGSQVFKGVRNDL